MSFRCGAVLGALVLLLAAVPPAEGARRPAKLTLSSLGALPATVAAGQTLTVRGGVRNLPRRRAAGGRLTASLRTRLRSRRGQPLLGTAFRRLRSGRGRRFAVEVTIPAAMPAGRYWLRVCVRARTSSRSSCRSRRVEVVAPVGGTGASQDGGQPGGGAGVGAGGGGGDQGGPGPGPGPGPGSGGQGAAFDALRSLRSAETDENFYFVMADRFENGRTDNDHGGYEPTKLVSGFDPTARGWYHGGDLDGIRDRLDYIEDLGTTAIWLTPSFKNKPVQGEGPDQSAGYHGYWITDFTQIDPHLGTNQELRALIDDAHARGMKVYFDIITNHTADVIDFREGSDPAYVPKDAEPFRTAAGRPFDDLDVAGKPSFPPLDRSASFPFTPFNRPGDVNQKTPEWLNDVTLYHNRGNTTFVGENALYGDFFGLDDLFTAHPTVVTGMIEIYKRWIRDFGIDGFRIDTMKHVNDEFWQAFAPEVLDFARAQGKREFFMFGEVFDTTKAFTSHFTTQDRVQAVLDFPFQQAARGFAAGSNATNALRDFFVGDDWYTDADSNAYQLPTFLGNHDMGRIGLFVDQANPGASQAERLGRDRLAHELMYLSRGNPVIFYGDEQGFVGDGGDQLARQDMFPSRVAEYNDDDLIGTDATTATSNFDRRHPLYRAIQRLADVTARHPALRDGAQQHRYSTGEAGLYAFSRIDRDEQVEYVVVLNNAEEARTAAVPTYGTAEFRRVYGEGPLRVATDAGALPVTVPALSAVVLRSTAPIPRSSAAPPIALSRPEPGGAGRDRVEVRAEVDGDSFYEVTFYAKVGGAAWEAIGTDDNAPYRVFHDVASLAPGTPVEYRAVVRDNAGHTATSAPRSASVAAPLVAIEAPAEGARVRGRVGLQVTATPERPHYAVRFQRRVGGGDWTDVGAPDTSSPVYTAVDDVGGLPEGTAVAYRAVLDHGTGQTTSAERSVTIGPPPVTEATVHYRRSGPQTDATYLDWGLHLWGGAIDFPETAWDAPRQRDGIDGFGAFFVLPIKDDTRPVNFIVHRPSGNAVPETREPGDDRAFTPIDDDEIWLCQGDPTVHTTEPAC